MKTTTNTAYYLQVVFLALIIGIGLQVATAWTSPTSAPPTQSVTAPITTSNVTQTKSGSFGVLGILSGNMLRTTASSTEGTACAQTGLIATDTGGVVLSCQGGTWRKSGGASTGGAVLSSVNYRTLFGGKTGTGIMSCGGSVPGTGTGSYTTNVAVAADGQSLTITPVGANINNCYAGYACNSYGCVTPAGTYTYYTQNANGVTYRKNQSLGLPLYMSIILDTTGWNGSSGTNLSGNVSFNGYFNN